MNNPYQALNEQQEALYLERDSSSFAEDPRSSSQAVVDSRLVGKVDQSDHTSMLTGAAGPPILVADY